jgi:hypothetical protein
MAAIVLAAALSSAATSLGAGAFFAAVVGGILNTLTCYIVYNQIFLQVFFSKIRE